MQWKLKIKKWLKTFLPNKNDFIHNHSFLKKFQHYLEDANLWQCTRHSVSCGVAIGLFVVFIPFPIQTLLALILCIILRANFIIAFSVSWISNPITFIPIMYFISKIGSWILNESNGPTLPEHHLKLTTLHDLWSTTTTLALTFGKSLFIGMPIVAFSAALLGYLLVNLIWQVTKFLQDSRKRKMQ